MGISVWHENDFAFVSQRFNIYFCLCANSWKRHRYETQHVLAGFLKRIQLVLPVISFETLIKVLVLCLQFQLCVVDTTVMGNDVCIPGKTLFELYHFANI